MVKLDAPLRRVLGLGVDGRNLVATFDKEGVTLRPGGRGNAASRRMSWAEVWAVAGTTYARSLPMECKVMEPLDATAWE